MMAESQPIPLNHESRADDVNPFRATDPGQRRNSAPIRPATPPTIAPRQKSTRKATPVKNAG